MRVAPPRFDRCTTTAAAHLLCPLARLHGLIRLHLGSGRGLAFSHLAPPASVHTKGRHLSVFLSSSQPWHIPCQQVKKDTPFKQWLFHTAFNLKLAALKAGSPWDKASAGLSVFQAGCHTAQACKQHKLNYCRLG